MGAYVNPEGMSKEDWLEKHGNWHPHQPIAWEDVEEGSLPVVLVSNPGFTAAAIGFNKEEYRVFIEPDGRFKEFYTVKIEDLHTVSSELKHYISPEHQQMRG